MARSLLTVVCVLTFSGFAAAQDSPALSRPAEQAPPSRTAAQLVNVRIELSITDQRADNPGPPKTVSMVVEDRQNGRIRTGRGNAALNVDGRAEIMREGRIRVGLSVEYTPQEPERASPMPIVETLTALLEDGKPLVVSQSADPSGDRKVRLELKATILK